MAFKTPRVLVILNGDGLSATGLSGGAVRTYETLRLWSETGKALIHAITTSGGFAKLRGFGLDWPATLLKASIIGKRERFVTYRLVSYLISVFHAYLCQRRIPEADMVISSSDFFCDTEVAVLLKKRRPSLKWTAMVYHLYTAPWKRPGNPLVNWGWYLLQQWSLRRIAHRADAVFVHDTESGDMVRDRLVHFGMDPARIHPMCNGVHMQRWKSLDPQGARPFNALFVGELRPNKGIFDLVPIWKEVCAVRKEARLIVVGGGASHLQKQLVAETAAAGLEDRIIFAGAVDDTALLKAYHSADIFISPSHEEGWGIAMCEAMASGLPVVAYDLPVYRRHYEGAFVAVPIFQPAEFARKILQLLSDSVRAGTLREIGLERASHYDWSRLAEREWEIMLKILQDPLTER